MNVVLGVRPEHSQPIVTQEPNAWHVSHVRNGRVHTYICETEQQARRFAQLLSEPLVLPAAKRRRATTDY